jgi:RHS repeat-associated protein
MRNLNLRNLNWGQACDLAIQLTSETRTFNGLGSFALSYAYNLAGELTSITNPWSSVVGYAYDKTGRVTAVSGSGPSSAASYAGSLSYRAFGLKGMSYGNGRTLSLQYDNRMRVTDWTVPSVLGWQYSYTDVSENTGRVMFAKNTASSTAAGLRDDTLDRSYDYDHLGRLIVSHTGYEARLHMSRQQQGDPTTYGPYSQAYGYDQLGNMTVRYGWGGWDAAYVNWAPTYTNNRLNTNPATGAAMQYDSSGNLTNDGYQSYTYDATGQQAYASATALSQSYDGDRLRGKKTENGVTTYYLRSTVLGGQVVAEIDGSGTWTRGYVYAGGQMLAIQANNQVSWVHQDPVTKSQRITNSSGTVTSTIDLDPWGGETAVSSNQAFQPHRFTSYERDANSGDEAMMRRYTGKWHRFYQPDPYDGSYDVTDPQSFNRYAYTQNDPVNFVDPTGLMCQVFTFEGTIQWVCDPYGFDFDYHPFGAFTGGGRGGGGGGAGGVEPQKPADALPFNSCDEFVSYLVNQAANAAKNVLGGLNVTSPYIVANNLGTAMMDTAFFGYETHIHNGYKGFKPELTANNQNAGVYGHVLGMGGAFLTGPVGWSIGAASDLFDRAQKMWGTEQGAAEVAGNKAGLAVGARIFDFIQDRGRDRQSLFNSLKSVLCE